MPLSVFTIFLQIDTLVRMRQEDKEITEAEGNSDLPFI